MNPWKNTQRSILLILLALLGYSTLVEAGGLEVHLDRTRVAADETLNLSVIAPSDSQGSPDFSPLTTDFEILDQAESTRMSIINGRASGSREWRLVLAPKRTGQLTIPSLPLGQTRSSPLSLEVLPAAAPTGSSSGEAKPLMLEVEADSRPPMVQGLVRYTVRILSRVPLRQAGLSEPKAGDALIERLGEDRHATLRRDGWEYQVTERRYALFPQHSGPLKIESPVLTAQLPGQQTPRGGHSGFGLLGGQDPFADLFERTRPVRLQDRLITLEVQPQPAEGST
ncbi:MAG: BatD family protein, partial [Pseudomonadota bacterium]